MRRQGTVRVNPRFGALEFNAGYAQFDNIPLLAGGEISLQPYEAAVGF